MNYDRFLSNLPFTNDSTNRRYKTIAVEATPLNKPRTNQIMEGRGGLLIFLCQ
jgi:hypothetical protein